MTRTASSTGNGPDAGRLVLPLAGLRAGDLPRVGGKAANLGELLHAGFPVPEGFCVTTDAYARFLEGVPDLGDLFDAVDALDADDVAAVRAVGARVRAALAATEVPDDVAAAVRASCRRVDPEAAYAVRSSATAEDLPDASFAGQQDTFLDVRGEEALLDAIRRCWTSLFTDRAIVYRARHGFDTRAVRLAVAVQRMVPAEASGVLFTVDPVSQNRHVLVIDAVAGLGEALVAGKVTPDAYRVDRRDGRILQRTLADRPGPNAGAVLNDDRVGALARLGVAVEAHFGAPQDLEWAFAADRLHLLQARPITSLYPIDTLRSPDGTLHVHFSVGHQQSMTRAMPPLSLSSILALLPGGREPYGQSRSFLHVAGGRLYADLTWLLRSRPARRGVFAMLSQLDAVAPEAVRSLMERPEFRSRPRPRPSFGLVRTVAGLFGRALAALVWRDLNGFRERTEADMDAFEADLRRRIAAAPPGRARGEAALAALRAIFPFLIGFMPVVGAGVASSRLLTRLAARWLDADELEALTLGVPGNAVNEMNLAIDDLAALALRSPELAARFAALDAADDARAWLAAAAGVDGGAAFVAAFDAFLERFGARAPAEIDLSMPRWREDPLPVLRVIAGALGRDGPSVRARFAGHQEARATAFGRLVERAGRGPLGGLRLRPLRRLYGTMLEVGGMREHHKFFAVRAMAVVKEAVEALADGLVARGALEGPGDVWYLDWPELLERSDGTVVDPDLRDRIARRRAAHARHLRLTPPLIVTSDGEIPSVRHRRDGAPDGALLGDAVSVGVVEGVARVVRDPGRDVLAPGEILVAEFTDPGWTPLFINAGGLVLEVGGALTHGAVVAREYGIPAVVGVRGATSAIRSGQRVRVDGVRGVVALLEGGASTTPIDLGATATRTARTDA